MSKSKKIKNSDIIFIKKELKEYFLNLKVIESLNNYKENLNNQINSIKEELKSLECIDFEKISDIGYPVYSHTKSNTQNTSSYIENGIMKQIEKKEKLISEMKEELISLETKIYDKNYKNTKIKNILNLLDEESNKLLFLYYGQKISVIEICSQLSFSEATFFRKNRKLLEFIYSLLRLNFMSDE